MPINHKDNEWTFLDKELDSSSEENEIRDDRETKLTLLNSMASPTISIPSPTPMQNYQYPETL